MLPTANFTFKVPNLNDDIELNCRLYLPVRTSSSNDVLVSGFAIFAHPYAPLGGCYDDPVVQAVGSILLRNTFILCTFNFRGATGSSGSTSWTGKAELADYVSVYIFMLHMINVPGILDHASLTGGKPLLILGGYSYGSMIASYLPDLTTIQAAYNDTQEDSSDQEVYTRAQEVAKVVFRYLEAQTHRGRRSLRVDDTKSLREGRQEIMIGGYESENASRRVSRDASRRSMDQVRHSFERLRNRLSLKGGFGDGGQLNTESELNDQSTFSIEPTIAYLLVSPLLFPVAGFTTMFSSLVFERRNGTTHTRPERTTSQNLTDNNTLAVYGDKDLFTSARKLRKWAQELEGVPYSRFRSEEIKGASHFWQGDGAQEQLRSSICAWIAGLLVARQPNDDGA